MDDTNFWLENQPIAYAVVNGLIGSVSLWAFWTPFITFLAQPIASAIMKQDICNAVNNITIPKVLPAYSGQAGETLLSQDPKSVQALNTTTISSLWLLAGLSITLSMWMVTHIINKGQLDVNHIIRLNVILFIAIISIELSFFVGVGLRFIPFNLRDLYDDIIDNVTTELKPFTQQ
jgi:hypothetical protein